VVCALVVPTESACACARGDAVMTADNTAKEQRVGLFMRLF